MPYRTGKPREGALESGASGARAVFRGRMPSSPPTGEGAVGEKRMIALAPTKNFAPAPRASFGQSLYIQLIGPGGRGPAGKLA